MALGLVVVLAIGAATPQGRAAGAQFLRFAGVEISREPGPTPVESPHLPGEVRMSLDEARRSVRFPVLVPWERGLPKEVVVSDGGRVVSLDYGDIRVDEFEGQVNRVFFQKFIHMDADVYRAAKVHDHDAVWINKPHEIWYLDREGREQTASAHLSSTTLIWQAGPTAVRLEGAPTLEDALRIAESAR